MDVRFLITFLEVAKTRHFGKAADNQYLTQSAVSARIKQLEQYFNTALFTRHRHSIQLTGEGEKLVPFAEQMVATLHNAKKALQTDKIQQLTIAGTGNALLQITPVTGKLIQQQYPGLTLNIKVANPEQLSRMLHERTVDMVFCLEALKSDDFYQSLICQSEMALYRIGQSDTPALIMIDWNIPQLEEQLKSMGLPTAEVRCQCAQLAMQLASERQGYIVLPANQPLLLTDKMEKVAELPDMPLKLYGYTLGPTPIGPLQSLSKMLETGC